MKVLMFGWEFPPFNSGGLGTACFGLTRALAQKNIDITFVLPKKLDVTSKLIHFLFADSGNKITIEEIDSLITPYISETEFIEKYGRKSGSHFGNTLFEEVNRYRLKAGQIAKKTHFDLIHAHDWLSFGAGVNAKAISKKPLIAHVHATEFDRSGGTPNPYVYSLEKEGLEKSNEIIAVSNYTKKMIRTHYGIPGQKINVVHNGLHSESWNDSSVVDRLKRLKNNNKKIVLFVGRLTFQKGPDYFIKVAAEVLKHDKNVYFVVAGSGDMEHQMIRLASTLRISKYLFFTGFLRGQELSQIYQLSDVYLMLSVSEPFGITALEAAASDNAVIVSKQSGVSEVLGNALKVDFWDTKETTNKVLALLQYPALKQTMITYLTKEAKNQTWDLSADKCIQIYNSISV